MCVADAKRSLERHLHFHNPLLVPGLTWLGSFPRDLAYLQGRFGSGLRLGNLHTAQPEWVIPAQKDNKAMKNDRSIATTLQNQALDESLTLQSFRFRS